LELDMTLSEILEPRRLSDREFTISVPDGWQQGRGAFGGLVLGSLARCIEEAEPDKERTIRSLTAVIAGPVQPGVATVRIEPMRRGNAVSTMRASLISEGEVLADMVAVLGRPRVGTPTWQTLKPPEMPDWRELPPAPIEPPIAPVFTKQFEYRVTGPLPFSGGSEAVASGWVRPKLPGDGRGAAYLVALIDAWWPASAACFDGPRPVATVTFTMEVVGSADGLDPAAPIFHTARAPVSADGYTVEFRELWGVDGRLLALPGFVLDGRGSLQPRAPSVPSGFHEASRW
jgi:acyl-CoA thioesterase